MNTHDLAIDVCCFECNYVSYYMHKRGTYITSKTGAVCPKCGFDNKTNYMKKLMEILKNAQSEK